MKGTLISLFVFSFFIISCSGNKGVDGFRDLKLGATSKEVLKTEICKNGFKVAAPVGLEAIKCGTVDIDNNKYPISTLYDGDKLIRIVIILGSPNVKVASDFYDALSGQYGKANVDKDFFTSRFTIMFSAIKTGLDASSTYPSVGWKNGSVVLFSDGDEMLLIYQVPNFAELLQKTKAKGKGL